MLVGRASGQNAALLSRGSTSPRTLGRCARRCSRSGDLRLSLVGGRSGGVICTVASLRRAARPIMPPTLPYLPKTQQQHMQCCAAELALRVIGIGGRGIGRGGGGGRGVIEGGWPRPAPRYNHTRHIPYRRHDIAPGCSSCVRCARPALLPPTSCQYLTPPSTLQEGASLPCCLSPLPALPCHPPFLLSLKTLLHHAMLLRRLRPRKGLGG